MLNTGNNADRTLITDCFSDGGTKILVANTSFAIDRLATDCAPLQWLRELSHNGLQALGKMGSGVVVWAKDEWTSYSREYEASKLAVYDTGVGMTAAELLELVGKSFSSGQVQSVYDNFGIGAKITALPENPLGLVYTTLKNGEASRLVLRCNSSGEWVTSAAPHSNASVWSVDVTELPPAVQSAGHGTCVTLLGKTAESDTTLQPDSSSKTKEAWIVKYLNSRYFQLPVGVKIRTEVGGSSMAEVRGQRSFLDSNSESRGVVDLKFDNFKARWWVLNKNAKQYYSGYARMDGHVAAVLSDEMYEMSVAGAQSAYRLRRCGVTFGWERVVIYFFNDDPKYLRSNTARTGLSTLDKQPYPWDELTTRFLGRIPAELKAHVEKNAPIYDASALTERVDKELRELFKRLNIGRYKADPLGQVDIDDLSAVPGGVSAENGGIYTGDASSGGTGGVKGSGSSAEGSGSRGTIVPIVFPSVTWVSESDGTRQPEDFPDRAAHYDTSSNKILINADFRVFKSLEKYWQENSTGADTADQQIRKVIQEEVGFMLIETVAAVLLLKKDKGSWDAQAIRHAHSDEALTAVSLQRTRIDAAVGKKLRTLGLV
jgi:hypothetical protein